jgi:hypothetical protein
VQELSMRLPLPAEIAGAQDEDGLVVAHPSDARVAQSREALKGVASAMHAAAPREKTLRDLAVVLSHADHQGFLNSQLHNFNLYPVAESEVGDPFEAGLPVRFVVVVNQPVAVQIESVITALSMLVARQAKMASVQSGEVPDIDRIAAETDEVAHNQVVDVLRHGWRAAAETVARQAVASGFALRVSYEQAAVAAREDVARRMQVLRRAYNELPIARDAVDRFVSAIAPRGQIVAGPEVPEAVRAFAQQELALGSIRQYLAEVLRDALVTGNGYLAFGRTAPVVAYALRPDTAVDLGDDMAAPGANSSPVRALHLRGLEQPGSRYGLGVLELALSRLQQSDVFSASASFARQVLATPSRAENHGWATRTLALCQRVNADGDRGLRQVLAPILTLLPEPVPDLYFEGRERL